MYLLCGVSSEGRHVVSRMPPLKGVFEHPACEQCAGLTRLLRREPHPKLGPKYELDTFECPSCGHKQTRDIGPS